MKTIKAWENFVITGGSYSDYGIKALAKARKDFTGEDVKKAWLSYYNDDNEDEIFPISNEISFEHWLVNISGYAEELPLKELWTGEYGRVQMQLCGEFNNESEGASNK